MSSFTFADSLQVAQFGLDTGEPLLRALLDTASADVAVVCGPSESALVRAGRLAPSARLTMDPESALLDSTVGAVVIAAQAERPFAMAEAALEAGKHVFMTRAFADAVQAERLVTLAESQGRCLRAGHESVHHPAFRHAERMVERGDLGQIRYLDVTSAGPVTPESLDSAFDHLAEGLAMANALLGQPVGVWAQGGAFLGDGHDVVFVTTDYAGGALARLHASTLGPRLLRRAAIVGSRQSVEVDLTQSAEPVRVTDPGAALADGAGGVGAGRGGVFLPRIAVENPARLQMEAFVAAIRENGASSADGEGRLEVARVLDAVRQSLADGVRVEVRRPSATLSEPGEGGR